ncbi:unnamed protein product [Diamesa hyperborea]
MVLKLLLVLLICSVVIASGTSCGNNGNVTAQDPKYFKFNKGFFFVHGLTNGESVVMYKTPDLKLIYVQNTFINDDCFHETRSYNIIENGTFVDHVKVLERKEEFSNRKTLSFNLDGKPVEIKFEVNTTGFTLLEGIKGTKIEIFEVKLPINNPGHGAKDVVSNDVSAFEFVNKDSIELTDMKNGRLFYQNYKDSSSISGSYVFKTSSDDYYTMDYAIENSFQDNPSINIEGYEVKDVFSFYKQIQIKVKYEGAIKKNFYFFESTGLSIAENYALWLSVGAQKPTHEGSMAN